MRIEKSGARRGGRSSHRPAPMAEINIIPLVDVVLVLLIIFMATTAFVKETGLDLKLPDAKTGAAASQNARDLTVALGKTGAMTLDGQITDETILRAALRSRVKRNPKLNLIIKGDAGIPYSRVVRVMDLAREAGLSSVSLGTRRQGS
ncbi:MAG TPA: biopolymer transporter ExbD [Abditibacterium sp.]|jgi:biopolymer transport protein ExbD